MIELTPKFFASLTEFAVPLDARALSALKHSALALDVYTWLAHRLLRVKGLTGERVTWKNLRDQFGQEYSDPKNFKRKMVSTLRSVLAVYPDARIEQVVGGLILLPSQPPVPKIVHPVRAIESNVRAYGTPWIIGQARLPLAFGRMVPPFPASRMGSALISCIPPSRLISAMR